MKVRELMNSPVHIISSDKSVLYATNMMNQLETGALIVMEHDTVLGITTSRDLRSSHPNRIVADAMTPNPLKVEANAFIWDAMKIMDLHRIKRLIVSEKDKIIGMITREAIKMKMSAYIDTLTDLYRAPYILSIGEHLLEERKPFLLIFIDMNDFGEINKRFGHPFGDEVIKAFARRLHVVANENDHLCRYAGDEFVMLCTREQTDVGTLVDYLSETFYMKNIPISASVGFVNGYEDPHFFSNTFRELLSKASLRSTAFKSSQYYICDKKKS